jgi:protochlorophyllide reductase
VTAFGINRSSRCCTSESLTPRAAAVSNDDAEPTLSRRDVVQLTGSALSAWMLGNSLPASASERKTLLLTGGNSGIGFEAARQLAAQGHTLVLPCRSLDKSVQTIERLQSTGSSGTLIPAECNLASLASIKSFAEGLPKLLPSDAKLDTVCLNAGISRNTAAKDVARTKEGMELTVGTNHFGHFYLNHLLLPMVNPTGGRIVVTASGVHDPESPGGAQGEKATLGDLKGLERDGIHFDMVDGNEFNADKAYKDSKLCNVLFTRELQKRLDASSTTNGIVANCFNPGLIVSSGLFRDQNKVFTKVFDFLATDLLKVGETPAWGGEALAYMTSVDSKGQYYSSPPGSSKYGQEAFGNQFVPDQVSKEAQDDAKGRRLWELTEQILGISA